MPYAEVDSGQKIKASQERNIILLFVLTRSDKFLVESAVILSNFYGKFIEVWR